MTSIRNAHMRQRELKAANPEHAYIYPGVIADFATGAGKSSIAGKLVTELFSKLSKIGRKKRILFIAPRIELVTQVTKAIKRAMKDAGLCEFEYDLSCFYNETSSELEGHRRSAFLSSTYQSLSDENTLHSFSRNHFDLIIVDEQHMCQGKASFERIMRWFFAPKIGFSATPKVVPDCEIFPQGIVVSKPYHELAEEGWLVPIRHIPLCETLVIPGVKVGQELTDAQHELVEGPGGKAAAIKLVEAVREQGCKTVLVKCGSVKLANDFADFLTEQGEVAFAYHSGIPKADETSLISDRDRQPGFFADEAGASEVFNKPGRSTRLKMFESGQARFLVICDMLSVGWDCPAVDAVAITCALPGHLFMQFVGRGLRAFGCDLDSCADAAGRKLAIANSSKPYCLIFDLAFAVNEHGHILTNGYKMLTEDKETGMEPVQQEGKEPLMWSSEQCEMVDAQFMDLCNALQNKVPLAELTEICDEWDKWLNIITSKNIMWPIAQKKLLRIILKIQGLSGQASAEFSGFKKTIQKILAGQAAMLTEMNPKEQYVSLLKHIVENYKKRKPNDKGKDSIHMWWAGYKFAEHCKVYIPRNSKFTDLDENFRQEFAGLWKRLPAQVHSQELLEKITSQFIPKNPQ